MAARGPASGEAALPANRASNINLGKNTLCSPIRNAPGRTRVSEPERHLHSETFQHGEGASRKNGRPRVKRDARRTGAIGMVMSSSRKVDIAPEMALPEPNAFGREHVLLDVASA